MKMSDEARAWRTAGNLGHEPAPVFETSDDVDRDYRDLVHRVRHNRNPANDDRSPPFSTRELNALGRLLVEVSDLREKVAKHEDERRSEKGPEKSVDEVMEMVAVARAGGSP